MPKATPKKVGLTKPKKTVSKLKMKTKKPHKAPVRAKKKPTNEFHPSTTNDVILKLWEGKKNQPHDPPTQQPENWKGNNSISPNSWDGHQSKFHGPRRRAS